MSFRLETFIAFRYLKSRRDESFISISSLFSFLGITIGVATLIVVMSVMNGFRYELVNKIVGINGHIILYLNGNSENKHSKVSNHIEALEEVESVSKEVEMHAMISSTSNSSGILVKGINKVDLFERSSISNGLIKGNLSNFDQNSIVIGTRLASFLRVGIDEKITLITASSTTTPFGNIPNTLEFVVKGIFDVGMYNFDRNIAFIPKELSTRLIGKNIDYASRILEDDGIVVIPTETVYGLGGNAININSVSKIYSLKKRPKNDPLICHTDSLDKILKYVKKIPENAYKLAEMFWPGPMTIIFEKKI